MITRMILHETTVVELPQLFQVGVHFHPGHPWAKKLVNDFVALV